MYVIDYRQAYMDNLSEELKHYLFATLGIKVNFRPWTGQNELPVFLANSFSFLKCRLLDQPCLIMAASEMNHSTPANIKKFWEQINSRFTGITIYVQTIISAYDRKRLIGHKIPFIVPGKQMYLPQIGIELREHFQSLHLNENQNLSPAAQTIVIYALLGKMGEKANPSILAKCLGYTSMSISRAFDELAAANIGTIRKVGKERWWSPSDTKLELWQQAKPKMRSPIQQLIWIDKKPRSIKPNIIAGLSALSQYSSLNPPTLPIYAIHKSMWPRWKSAGVEKSQFPHEALFELQIWYYNPALFSENNIVDPFSLYLSLQGHDDERVEIALEEMMRDITW